VRYGLSLMCASACAACGTARPEAAERAPQAAPELVCPRLARAPRIWTGFAVDVPSNVMHLALDVLAPIQEALGGLFCTRERAACRPAALLSVVLADASASSAQVEVETSAAAGGKPAVLSMRELQEQWHVEPESLRAFLTGCLGSAKTE
jgi:hypothetical protein